MMKFNMIPLRNDLINPMVGVSTLDSDILSKKI